MKKLLLSFLMMLSAALTMSAITITGLVVDEKYNPICGASVVVKGTTNGTITDVDGCFSLEVPELPVTLEVSFIGYLTMETSINSTTVKFIMKEDKGEVVRPQGDNQ